MDLQAIDIHGRIAFLKLPAARLGSRRGWQMIRVLHFSGACPNFMDIDCPPDEIGPSKLRIGDVIVGSSPRRFFIIGRELSTPCSQVFLVSIKAGDWDGGIRRGALRRSSRTHRPEALGGRRGRHGKLVGNRHGRPTPLAYC